MSNRRSRLRGARPVTLQNPILGAALIVDGTLIGDGFDEGELADGHLMKTVQAMVDQYQTSGLPPKMFYFQFERSHLLILFSRRSTLLVWTSPHANLVEIEIAARKVVSTAHLRGALNPTNPVVAALNLDSTPATPLQQPTPATPAETSSSLALVPFKTAAMTWSDAIRALENIITKVLSQAQAARLIGIAVQKRNVDLNARAEATKLAEIGAELTQKIPSRPIRATLEREVAELVKKL